MRYFTWVRIVTCAVCHKEFEALRRDARYCSTACRTKACRMRKISRAQRLPDPPRTIKINGVVEAW